MIRNMWPLLPYYLVLIVLIALAIRHASKLDILGEKIIYLVGARVYRHHYNKRLQEHAPRHRLPNLGRGYVSVPKNEDEFRAFFLHEIEFQLDTQLEFTRRGEVKLSKPQRRMLETYFQHRDMPYANVDQAFSDVGLKLAA
jgi:hypothetical protein